MQAGCGKIASGTGRYGTISGQGVSGDITRSVSKACFRVYSALEYGFLDRVYRRAMSIAARSLGLLVTEQWPIHMTILFCPA